MQPIFYRRICWCVCVVDCQEPIKDSVNELSENTTVYVLRGMFVQLMKRK